MFEVRGLRYRDWGPFSLELAPADCLYLYGRSGSGKSLFLRSLADLDPHEGEVLVGGVAQGSVSGPEWRRRVGLMPAEPVWWYDTVGEHFPTQDDKVLSQLGFPEDTWSWPVQRLSLGEQRRLALLRLLQYEPKVLLLDEPTANLDPENTDRVEEMVAAYRREHQVPVVWVGHDHPQAERVADCIFQMRGRALERER